MSKEQNVFEGEEKPWEDLQGGRSGMPPDNMDNRLRVGSSAEDDIIELADVVREGDRKLYIGGADDLSPLFDQEEGTEKKEDFLGRENDDLNDFSIPLDETPEEEPASRLSEPDALYDHFESPDFDFEAAESLEGPLDEDMADISEDKLGEIPEEDMKLVMAGWPDEAEDETSRPDATDEQLPAVSQERIEAVITHAVTEVVERVVRETVAEVAERVIREAIESLKQSVDTTPE
jgi:hypothetical protein